MELLDLGIDILIRGKHPTLWDIVTQRETLRFLRKQGQYFSDSQLDDLVNIILKGPPRNKYNETITNEEWMPYKEYLIRTRLFKLIEGGVTLPKEAAKTYERIQKKHPWNPKGNHAEEFPVYFSAGGGGEKNSVELENFATMSIEDFIVWAETQTDQIWQCSGGWDQFIEDKPILAVDLLEGCIQQSKYPPHPWYSILSQFEWLGEKISKTQKLRISKMLTSMPPNKMKDIALQAARWLEYALAIIPKRLRRNLWDAIWEGSILIEDAESSPDVDLALNHPGGILGEVLYKEMAEDIPQVTAGENPGFPNRLKSAFRKIGEQNNLSAKLARVRIVSRLYILNRIDRDWTHDYLLQRMDLESIDFDKFLWEGFLWSASWATDLVKDFKALFTKTLKSLDQIPDRVRDNAIQLFIYIAIPPERMISKEESKDILYQFTPDDLAKAAGALKDMLSAAGSKSSELWKKTIGPWFSFSWPKMPIKRSSELSTNLAIMAIKSNDAFPGAVAETKDCLIGVEYSHALHEMQEAEEKVQLVRRFPDETLILLDKIIQENTHVDQDILTFILETIRDANPARVEDDIYQRLRR